MTQFFTLIPNPGRIPTAPPPALGESILIEVEGLPPYKDRNRSIRNVKHPAHHRFIRLREEAITRMNGRAWFDGPITLDVTIYAADGTLEADGHDLIEYAGGIMDTLDGSHGPSFTYLPIVMQDDRQVRVGTWEVKEDGETHYKVNVYFGERARSFGEE